VLVKENCGIGGLGVVRQSAGACVVEQELQLLELLILFKNGGPRAVGGRAQFLKTAREHFVVEESQDPGFCSATTAGEKFWGGPQCLEIYPELNSRVRFFF